MKPFVLIQARSLPEAARESSKPDAELKAGGVDLLDRMKEGLDSPKTVVSLSRVPGLDGIEIGPPATVGALATLAKLAAHPGLRKHYSALADAAAGAATPQIRNMATLGGNLCQRPRCWYYRLEEFDCRKKGGSRMLRAWRVRTASTPFSTRTSCAAACTPPPRARRSWPTARAST